jgi:hypothetical protein
VLHVAFFYLEAALISALTLRQHEPLSPITLLSDRPQLQGVDLGGTGISLRLVQPDLPAAAMNFSSRWIKTSLASLPRVQERCHPSHSYTLGFEDMTNASLQRDRQS